MASYNGRKAEGSFEHFAHFYESDDFIASLVSKYIVEGLRSGETCIVAATPKHLAAIERNIAASFGGLEASRRSGMYIPVDPADMLSKILINGMPDAGRFSAVCEEFIKEAVKRGSGVRMFGEGTAILWAEEKYEAAYRLEELWNDLGGKYQFSLFCAYPMSGFIHGRDPDHVCGGSARTVSEGNYKPLACADERLRAISLLHLEHQKISETRSADI